MASRTRHSRKSRRHKKTRNPLRGSKFTLEQLETRRLLTCVAGGADENDQTCEAFFLPVGSNSGTFNISPTTDVDMF